MELKKQKEDTNEKAKSTKKKPQEQRGNELTTMTPIVSNSRKKNSKEANASLLSSLANSNMITWKRTPDSDKTKIPRLTENEPSTTTINPRNSATKLRMASLDSFSGTPLKYLEAEQREEEEEEEEEEAGQRQSKRRDMKNKSLLGNWLEEDEAKENQNNSDVHNSSSSSINNKMDVESFLAGANEYPIAKASASYAKLGVDWARFVVVKSHSTNTYLELVCMKATLVESKGKRKKLHRVRLFDSWLEETAPLSSGDVIHVVLSASSASTLECELIEVSDEKNFLIVCPDSLVSPTSIADSTTCARKSFLCELDPDAVSSGVATVMGNLKHKLFEAIVREESQGKVFGDVDQIRALFRAAVLCQKDVVEQLLKVDITEEECVEQLEDTMADLSNWGAQHFAHGELISFDGNKEIRVRIKRVLKTEEFVYSPMWGVKGALDATVELEVTASGGRTFDIVTPLELKTGKSLRVEHRAQVILYQLLINDRYYATSAFHPFAGMILHAPTVDRGNNTIKSSGKASELSLCSVKLVRRELVSLIQVRNKCVASRRKGDLEDWNGSHVGGFLLPEVTGNKSGECARCFKRAQCALHYFALESGDTAKLNMDSELLNEDVGLIPASALRYFNKWTVLLELELPVKLEEIWQKDSNNSETARVNLRKASTVPGFDGHFVHTFVSDEPEEWDSIVFDAGDAVVISLQSRHHGLERGTLMGMSGRDLVVKTLNEFRVEEDPRVDRWRVDRLERYAGNKTLRSFLQRFVLAKTNKFLPLVVDLTAPRFWDVEHQSYLRNLSDVDVFCAALGVSDSPEELRYNIRKRAGRGGGHSGSKQRVMEEFRKLTEDQQKAVLLVVAAADYVNIMGMPGSGKTTTIAFLVLLLSSLNRSVLLTSFTNTALDNICLKVKEFNLPLVRVGYPEAVTPSLHGDLLSSVPLSEMFQLSLKENLIMGATCYGMKHAFFKKRRFDYAILDEAGQMIEAATLACLLTANVSVFVGDVKQLSPLVKSPRARELGMNVSLMERLAQAHQDSVVYLTRQFRMNRDISALANGIIYENQLVCGNVETANRMLSAVNSTVLERNKNSPAWLLHAIKADNSVVFLDMCGEPGEVEKNTQDGRALVINEKEALVASLLVNVLKRAGVPLGQIGIITPYRSQIKVLRKHVKLSIVEVETVDRFQGRDKLCIILSMVCSNKNSIGNLLEDWRRLNVAITRPKCKLIIIGSADAISSSRICNDLVKFCQEKNWVSKVEESFEQLVNLCIY